VTVNAGKAFIDFYLGDERMKILARSGEFANRKGIDPPPGAEKIQYTQRRCSKRKPSRKKKSECGTIFSMVMFGLRATSM